MLANRSIPQCAVIPALPCPDVVRSAKWLCKAFGFTLRIGMGSHRAQLNVGDGAVVLTELPQGEQPYSPNSVIVRVEDVDRHHEQAIRHGAQILRPPANYPYGERQYTAVDLAGHRWTFSQSIEDIAPEDWGGTSGQL